MKEKRIQIEGQDTLYLVRDDGTIWSEKRNRILKGTVKRNEYCTVYLTFNNKQYNFMIHRLVAEAFCENPNNYTIVHHKNNDKHDNRAENLEWVTTKENSQKAIRLKVKTDGEQADLSKEWLPTTFSENYLVNKDGELMNAKTKKLIKGADRNGYKRFEYRGKFYSIHRLIYEAFNGKIPEGKIIDHIDGNRANNKLENLRLVSQSTNMLNAYTNGHKGQIPVLQFDKQGNFIHEYSSIQEAADAMGVTHAAVRSAVNRNGTCKGYKWEKKKD